MPLLDDAALARSPIVANNRMNRERGADGVNSYARELGFSPVQFLAGRLVQHASARWLDLCCGRARALLEAFEQLDADREPGLQLYGVDLVRAFDPLPEAAQPCVCLEVAALHRYAPEGRFDLVTCVHGLHYVGDKLGLIARATSWLNEDGVFAANLDLHNVRSPEDAHFTRRVKRWFKECGFTYDSRRHLLTITGCRTLESPFEYLGADPNAGPNYTGQEAVHSYYQ